MSEGIVPGGCILNKRIGVLSPKGILQSLVKGCFAADSSFPFFKFLRGKIIVLKTNKKTPPTKNKLSQEQCSPRSSFAGDIPIPLQADTWIPRERWSARLCPQSCCHTQVLLLLGSSAEESVCVLMCCSLLRTCIEIKARGNSPWNNTFPLLPRRHDGDPPCINNATLPEWRPLPGWLLTQHTMENCLSRDPGDLKGMWPSSLTTSQVFPKTECVAETTPGLEPWSGPNLPNIGWLGQPRAWVLGRSMPVNKQLIRKALGFEPLLEAAQKPSPGFFHMERWSSSQVWDHTSIILTRPWTSPPVVKTGRVTLKQRNNEEVGETGPWVHHFPFPLPHEHTEMGRLTCAPKHAWVFIPGLGKIAVAGRLLMSLLFKEGLGFFWGFFSLWDFLHSFCKW